MVILSMAGLFACVKSFLPTSSLPSQSAKTLYKSETISTTTILHLAIVVADTTHEDLRKCADKNRECIKNGHSINLRR
jgi:hypothetical protein